MHPESPRWKAITESQFPWEREALEYVREGLPDREPYRAWSNFEFVADDGSVNEVDLLVLSPGGFFLVEIKSRPGAVRGDAGTWTWRHDGQDLTVDNPLILTNRKAKRLKGLLERKKPPKAGRLPFLEALVFLSATNLQPMLETTGRHWVYGRDERASGVDDALPGILATLTGDIESHRRARVTTQDARVLEKAMDAAGIRRSQRHRRVGDYRLEELLADGEAWQDWLARHNSLDDVRRRVRIYTTAHGLPASEKQRLERAAEREFRLLEGISHPGILKALEYKKHELGPALFFEHHPGAQRLDHHLQERGGNLVVDTRLHLVRVIAEALAYAHERRLYHRGLSPENVLVLEPHSTTPAVKLFDWRTGARDAATTTFGDHGRSVSGTTHVGDLVREGSAVYMAPELRRHADADGVAADLFSLGALTFLIFTGRAPADSAQELYGSLKAGGGLRLAAAMDGAPDSLDTLVFCATCPEVSHRLDSVTAFLAQLDEVEEELTQPEADVVDEPNAARPNDLLPGGLRVLRRLGQGSTSLVFLVDDHGTERVLKLARATDKNDVLENEAEVLEKLRHHGIVEIHRTVEMYGRVGILMAPAGRETLAERLRQHGRLELELLERFGDDLLGIVSWLEEQGIPHRDIKPENLGVRPSGKKDTLHLVLFDFSLSRAPAEKLSLGTTPYLDPFLDERPAPRWDLAAERFSVAVTLHEMATGALPIWGDGKSDPALVDAELNLDPEAFPPGVRQQLADFFRKALARDATERFDNAGEMRRAWGRALDAAAAPALPTDHLETPTRPLEVATLASHIVELGLSSRATQALERLGVETVRDLLTRPLGQLSRMRGVGTKTRGELLEAVRILRTRFPEVEIEEPGGAEPADETASLDRIAALLLTDREASSPRGRALRLYLGLEDAEALDPWPSQTQLADHLEVTRARIHQILDAGRKRWAKTPVITALRRQAAERLAGLGGIAATRELEDALLSARGSVRESPERERLARAVARAVVETEGTLQSPAYRLHRRDGRLLVALHGDAEADGPPSDGLASWAAALGEIADELASGDPLPSPTRAIEELRAVSPPDGTPPLPHRRLVQLAAASSTSAAASARLELYPRGMDSARAVRLAAGSLLGLVSPTAGASPAKIRERIHSRYPEAAPLPGRPDLDTLLADPQIGLEWDATAEVYRFPPGPGVLSTTSTRSRFTFTPRPRPEPETVAAHDFQGRLERALRQGGYLLLLTQPRFLTAAERRLHEAFGDHIETASLERLLLAALHRAAEDLGVAWPVVLRADAEAADSRDGRRLRTLVAKALPEVEEELLARTGALLLTHPGLLARYHRFDLLERLRDRLAKPAPGGLQSLWVLAPGDEQAKAPRIDGRVVPVVTPAEWARIPPSWIDRAHLAAAESA